MDGYVSGGVALADQAKIVCCSHLRSFQFCSFNFLLEFSSCANKLSNMLAVLCFPVQNYCSLDFTVTLTSQQVQFHCSLVFLNPNSFHLIVLAAANHGLQSLYSRR